MLRKKVGIATIVALNNYGAVLQSYALVAELNNLGYTAEIIDLREVDQDDCNMFVKIKDVKDVLRNLRKIPHYKAHKQRMLLFNNFVTKYLPLSPNYFSGELENIDERYDVLCTGSDQTFNVLLNAFKKEFFLTFCEDLPKISYASSFGEYCNNFTETDKKWIKDQLLKYKFLSIREKKGVELVKSLTGRVDITHVLDPTLLLDSEHWKKLIKNQNEKNERYILFYSVLSEPWVVEKVNEISRATGLPVFAPHLQNQYEIGSKFERVIECGPCEFLNLIANAELVLTTSFHATVFSFQFEKPFYSFILGEGNRIGSFLELVNLKERAITENQNIEIDFEIDYTLPKELLDKERIISRGYLENALQVIEHEKE